MKRKTKIIIAILAVLMLLLWAIVTIPSEDDCINRVAGPVSCSDLVIHSDFYTVSIKPEIRNRYITKNCIFFREVKLKSNGVVIAIGLYGYVVMVK